MESEKESKKQIVKSSSIIGGASAFNILISLVKIKVLAILLGPSGIGLMSLFSSIMNSAATLSGMGIQTSGVRQLAQEEQGGDSLDKVRLALWTANIALGVSGGLVLWFFRLDISNAVFADSMHATEVGLLGFGVFFALAAASQTTLLQGLREISAMAKVKIGSALISTLIGLPAIFLLGTEGIVIFVLAVPLASVLVAWYYCLRLPKPTPLKNKFTHLIPQWKLLVSLGFVFMLTALMTQLTQLVVRYLVSDQFDMAAVGHFQAAWVISMTYIGFVLAAMGADYYPRLVAIIGDKKAANGLANHQIEVALVLAAPVLIIILALAPIVVTALYSSEFTITVEILRWQVLGDIFKIFSWPLGFVLLAMGKAKLFFLTELVWNLVYCSLVYIGMERFGLTSTGYAFVITYIVHAIMLYFIVKSLTGWRISSAIVRLFSGLLASAMFLQIASYYSNMICGLFGVILFVLFSFIALRQLNSLGLQNTLIEKINRIINRVEG